MEGSKRHRRVGYWGDVLTGPFPALALASADPRAAKTQNGYSVHVRDYTFALYYGYDTFLYVSLDGN